MVSRRSHLKTLAKGAEPNLLEELWVFANFGAERLLMIYGNFGITGSPQKRKTCISWGFFD
jgi:hypothetical protein